MRISQKIWNGLRADDRGFVVSIEVVLVGIVAVVGLVAALSATRDAFIGELSDVAGSFQDLNQSFIVNGTIGHSSTSAGMGNIDQTDHCDDNNDTAGQPDNCITIDGGIPNVPMSVDGLVLSFDFDDDASDSSPNGQDNDGTLRNGATVHDCAVHLDGIDDFITVANTPDINTSIHDERTVTLTFNADEVTSRQVLYEEGASVRGLVIYIENGELIIGGWNRPTGESGWNPTYISTPITAGTWNTATLVLDGTGVVTPNALTGFLNGSSFGSTSGSQLWIHGGGIGIGGTNGTGTLFAPGGTGATGGFNFGGQICGVGIYNRAVSDAEIAAAGGGAKCQCLNE